MNAIFPQIFGEKTDLESPLSSNQSLRVDKKGQFLTIDTSLRSSWKGYMISFVQWLVYGSAQKACDKAHSQAIDRIEKTALDILLTCRDHKTIQSHVKQAQHILDSFKCDPDFSKNEELTQRIDTFKNTILTRFIKNDSGNAAAHCYMGVCYAKGDGITQNHEEALIWYEKAAEQGYASAQSKLAYCYEQGIGVQQNYTKALHWYKEAAQKGDIVAQNNLAVSYAEGVVVKQNLSAAFK